jgi:hypothetical protein
MQVRLELDEFVLDVAASNVLNDPIDELVTIVRDAHRTPKPHVRACLWLEPAGYAIDVSEVTRDTSLIRIGTHDSSVPPMNGAVLRTSFEGEVRTSRLRSAITSGLLELLRQENAAAVNGWQRGKTLRSYVARLDEANGAAFATDDRAVRSWLRLL